MNTVVMQALAEWNEGANTRALQIVEQGLEAHPHSTRLLKLQGNILTTSRRDQEALEAYDAILRQDPSALDVRWAKWSVLLRSGQGDHAAAELQNISAHAADNPLAVYRLAQELRKLDRLEESVEWYEKAVHMVPALPGWRLAFARARFDVLDGRGARDEVKEVLSMVKPGTPEEAAARSLLSVVYGATKERGRRYEPIFSPEGTAAERKEWASIRAESWRLVEAGRYQEAEPVLRRVLALKPSDYRATHDLGRTLMALDRCEEAVTVFDSMANLSPSDEVYADTFFRIGRCLMKLEQWSEALVHFQILYDAAVEFEQSNKGVRLKADLTILDKDKLQEWIAEVQQHLPHATPQPEDRAGEEIPPPDPGATPSMTEEQAMNKILAKRLTPENPLYTRASLMGRDADFSLFRFVIPATRVMRDDRPGGTHEFIPINPHDTFTPAQEEILLVFGLVTASFDEVPLQVQCFVETSSITEHQTPLATDYVVMAMSEQTGYFVLTKPDTGWRPGLYRCGLFVGEEVSAYTHADEVRFRIIDNTDT